MIFEFPHVLPSRCFNDAPERWTQWQWQMQNILASEDEFSQVLALTDEERAGFKNPQFKVAATPYYISLVQSAPALRRIAVPMGSENSGGAQQMHDPLGEDRHSVGPNLIHRYSDRVLFLLADTCSVYCRFCTRKRYTGSSGGLIPKDSYDSALEYIRNHTGIREVIFSGGDPLTVTNLVLERVLNDVRRIPHIEIIRIGTRMPVVCPMRIDEDLCRILRRNRPVYMMTHFNHPKELTFESRRAVEMLVDHGVPVFNQMVLLNGVNNDAAVVQALSRRLLYLRVKPYYLFQCDPSEGTDHLRTPIEVGEAIVRELWGHLSGLAMPNFSLDIPNGGGKTTLTPDFMVHKTADSREFVGWDGIPGCYMNPQVELIPPADKDEYKTEWDSIRQAKSPL